MPSTAEILGKAARFAGVAFGAALAAEIALFAVAGSVALKAMLRAARMEVFYAPPRLLAHRSARPAQG
ncbi:hypothetical protein [Rhodovulum sulfidophilum]|uniref:Uncharacterized protein n=1 Tax=Rhodovulum sulfidophilum TaxID=35806 RepID=A0ABS1RWL4_RHOSU|nr:hypothetical protein [Rhodovulum sulfidophilum]MBL3610272.1 hypothetical protein [Rhodovulum sulfidophilum]MCE8458386.1 hypothetical protein [Rhodovulum sulfidophilum]